MNELYHLRHLDRDRSGRPTGAAGCGWRRFTLVTAVMVAVALVGCSDDEGKSADSVGGANDTATATDTQQDTGASDTGASDADQPDSGGGDGVQDDTAQDDTAQDDTAQDDTAQDDAGSTDADATSDAADTTDVSQPPVEIGGTKGMAVNVLDKTTKLKVQVRVVDAAGRPIVGATVSLGGAAIALQGDAAELKDVAIDKSPVLTASAPGHASASMILDPVRALSGVHLVLQKYEQVETFSALAGGKLAGNAVKVQIPANGVVDAAGKAYTGKVTMAAASIDLDRDLLDGAGGLKADAAGLLPDPAVKVTTPAGAASMIKLASSHVALKGEDGGDLQLAAGKPAKIDFKLSPTLATSMPDAYKEGAQLNVISRDEKTGAWSASSKCTVAKGASGWSCAGEVPHFSEAAVAEPMKYGCIVVGSVGLSAPADKDVVWRAQLLQTRFGIGLGGHYYDNKGALGMCALVPLDTPIARVALYYQLGAKGTPVSEQPVSTPGTIFVKQHVDLGKPVDNNVDPKTMDNSSIDGCMAACAGVTPLVVAASAPSLPKPLDPSGVKLPNVEVPEPPAAPTLPSLDTAAIDLDQDGSPAGEDCDDEDATRSPKLAEVCGDGWDQDCDDKDAACPLTCFQAGLGSFGACAPGKPLPESATETACVGAWQPPGPFLDAPTGEKWKALQTCVAACSDGNCVKTSCGNVFQACVGDTSKSCGEMASCRIGCEPLNLAGLPALYSGCLLACPQAASDDQAFAYTETLLDCGGAACLGGLSCAATAKAATSACKDSDMACFGKEASCKAAFESCFDLDKDQDGSPASKDCDDNDPTVAPGKGEICGDGKDQDCDSKDVACPLTCTQAAFPCLSACTAGGFPTTSTETACVAKCTAAGPFVTAAAEKAWTDFQSCIGGCADGECVQNNCPAKVDACIGSQQTQASCADLASCRLGCEALNLAGLGPQYASCLAACPQDALDPTAYQHLSDLLACGAAKCVGTLSCSATEQSPTSGCKASDMSCFAAESTCNTAYQACFNP